MSCSLQIIVNELSLNHHSSEDDSFEVNLKTTIMSFLNALINCGAGEVTEEICVLLKFEIFLLELTAIAQFKLDRSTTRLSEHE